MRILLVAMLAMGVTSGCVLPVPTPHGQTIEGTEVRPAELAFMRPSVTTKAEVIQRLGQPDIFWRDENTLVYRWVVLKGVLLWAIAGGYSADCGALNITAEYAFLVKFDTADCLVTSETVCKPATQSFGQFLLNWRDTQQAKKLGGQGSHHEH